MSSAISSSLRGKGRMNCSVRFLSTSTSTPSTSTHSIPASTSNPPISSSTSRTSTSSSSLRTAILVSRPAPLLRTPTALESTYFQYNQKLKFNLSQPFPKDFYFKKGSSAEARYQKEQAQRIATLTPNASTKNQAQVKEQVEVESESTNPDQDLYKTLPRTTEADELNDQTSLERKLDEKLFLLVKEKNGRGSESGQGWRLPSINLIENGEKQLLHKAAPSALTSILGTEMDIWLISNLPVGVLQSGSGVSSKTYILPAHILSGEPSKSLASKNGIEFLWLTKEEAEERIEGEGEGGRKYWEGIKGLMS